MKRTELTNELTTVALLLSPQLQSHINDLSKHGYTSSEIASQICHIYGIDSSDISATWDLANISHLTQVHTGLEKDLAALETQYSIAMKSAIELHRKAVFEQDEKRREVLQFINNIGFDLLPKAFTEQIITEVRSGITQLKQLYVNPANLDLANGLF